MKIKPLRHQLWLGFWRSMPLQKNKIILWSDNFKSFGCSPKYIALYLAENYPEKFDIVWVMDRERKIPQDMPTGIRIVRYFSMDYLREIATAKIIICNVRTGDSHYFKKRKGQYYIQTWHSSLRLKKIEGDAPSLPENYVNVAREDSQKIDLLLSGCQFSSEIYRRAFWYKGEILEKGTPRCDVFFKDSSEIRKKVFSYFDISPEKKFVLYAPTFRKNKKAEFYHMDFAMLQKALGPEWVIGCRLHPNIHDKITSIYALPMSDYSDMQELLLSCDMLITDYSSSMFDLLVAGKKCALYVPDLEEYIENERGLYFNIEQLPFPKAKDMEMLCNRIQNWDGYDIACKKFLNQIGNFEDGNAAKAVAERVLTVTGV